MDYFNIIRFENGWMLWLLLLLVPMVLYYIYTQRRGGVAVGVSSIEPVKSAGRTANYWIRHIPFALLCLAVGLTIFSAARPQSTSTTSNSTTEGIDIVVALDISTSMLARDFTPDRFAAAKEISSRFMLDRPSDRIGLVVFAGEAFTQAPLTSDHRTLVNLLSQVQMGIIADGTAIGNGLTTAVNRLRGSDSPSKVVVLLTDGENNSGQIDPLTAAEVAKEFGVKVYTIGVGSEGMAPYPAIDMWGDVVYQDVEVKIDEELLTEISEMTGGKYFRATDNSKLSEIYNEINQLEKAKIEVESSVSYQELFVPFLAAAIALLLLMALLNYLILRKIP